jgi:hypothetical protein
MEGYIVVAFMLLLAIVAIFQERENDKARRQLRRAESRSKHW